MAAVTQPPNLCVVTELLSGTVFDLLHNSSVKMSWKLKLSIAIDTARGLNYLHQHSPPIIHRDLKSPNLLLDGSSRQTKVCDFGLARSHSMRVMTGQIGTFQWMAPEVMSNNNYTEKADVYSFGIILWELLTRQLPYANMNPLQVSQQVVHHDMRPNPPKDCPKPYLELMTRCWHKNPRKRPSFDIIVTRLEMFVDHLRKAAQQRMRKQLSRKDAAVVSPKRIHGDKGKQVYSPKTQ